MSLGHSHDDLRARDAALEPLPGGAISVCAVCPGRNAGRGGVAAGGFALTNRLTLNICINIRPHSRPKITSPLPSGVWQSAEEV